MPGLDWIPGVSQLKSTVQLLTGDVDGALRTQANFCQECPVLSQAVSLGQVVVGDTDGALETQKKCLGTLNNVANGLPVVGHVKGAIHYAVGDTEGGHHAMNAASRSAVVLSSGAGAALLSGGLAAIPAGIAAGAAYDTAGTLITDEPQGLIAAIDRAIDEPNGGNIFEAAFVPVGDGMGGYAGGKLATSIATKIKISNLEAARSSKAALIEDSWGGNGGGGGLKSGQVLDLGKEINALTRQINLLKHGTAQYWFDPKSGDVFTTKPPSGAVAVPGYISEKDEQKIKDMIKTMYNSQSDGILSDDYAGQQVAGSYETDTAKKTKCQAYKEQKTQRSMTQAYLNVPVLTKKKIDELKRKQHNPQDQNSKILLQALSWLEVHMPDKFNYTGAVLRNDARQGLLHSFLRHSNQWADVIPRLNQDIQNITSICQELIKNIGRANSPTDASDQLDKFIAQTLSDDDREALSDIQMRIYDFLNRNIIYSNYLGEGINNAGRMQVFFKVIDKWGNVKVMVVCVSEQLYPPNGNFVDPRPVRTITTIYFITLEEALKKLIDKIFR